MKVNINQSDLSQLLQVVQKAVPGRTTKMALQQILLEAAGQKLTATASDLNFGITASVPCEVIEEGAVLVDPLIATMAKRMNGSILLEDHRQKRQIIVKDARKEVIFSTLDEREYPAFPKVGDKLFSIPGRTLVDCVQKTVYAVSKSDTRPLLNNLHIVRLHDELRFEATDSHRLAIAVTRAEGIAENAKSLLINGQHLKVFTNLLVRSEKLQIGSPFVEDDGYAVEARSSEEVGEIVLEDAGTHLVIRTPKFVFFVSLQEGNYPNFDKAIPESPRRVGGADRNELLNAAEESMLFAKEFEHLDADLSIAETGMILEAGRDGVRKFRETIPLTDGEVKADLRYNARYLRDMVAALDGNEVVLQEKDGRLMASDQTSMHMVVNIRRGA